MALIQSLEDERVKRLKTLKYGRGTDDGPYIQIDINTGFPKGIRPKDVSAINQVIGFDDGFVRGGTLTALKSSILDTIRIGKFFVDNPLFIARQVALQLSNPRIATKNFTIPRDGFFQPTRIYNLGLNTLTQIPSTAFGIHFNRHGLLPEQDENTKYETVTRINDSIDPNTDLNSNRLVNLTKRLIKPGSANELQIDNYLGGPNSTYGIGNTIIHRVDITDLSGEKIILLEKSTTNTTSYISKTSYITDKANTPDRWRTVVNYDVTKNTHGEEIYKHLYDNISANPLLQMYGKLAYDPSRETLFYDPESGSIPVSGLNNETIYYDAASSTELTQDITYTNYAPSGSINRTKTVTLKGFKRWLDASREQRIGSDWQDSINLTPIFDAANYFGGDSVTDKVTGTHNIRDLVRFRIQAVDGDNPDKGKWMVFRAYLSNLSDSTNASWNDIQYIGRGEKFYVYSGFTRKIQIGFKVAALSVKEMRFIYQKLNYLMGNLMPDYSGVIMRGPLVRMSVGSWLDSQLGIIDSLTYTVPNDAPWEIALDEPEGGEKVLILPHIVEVNLTFTPIGSETAASNNLPEKSLTTSHIAQNNTADVSRLKYIEDNSFAP